MISPDEQIECFIIEPSEHLHSIGPSVIVIDAPHESGRPRKFGGRVDSAGQYDKIASY
jgi:hypothetical protein